MKLSIRFSLVLVLLVGFSVIAQDLPEQMVGSLNTKINHQLRTGVPSGVTSINEVLSGSSTSANSRAPQGGNTMRYERCYYLITAAELAAYGVPNGAQFTTLGFSYAQAQNTPTTGTFQVYFMNTSDVTNGLSTSWATAIAGFTKVDSGSATIPAATVFDITLTNPSAFTYTGGGLYVAWEYSNPSTTPATTYNIAYCNINLTNGLKSSQSASVLPSTLAASNYRPVTRLSYLVGKDAAVKNIYTMGKLALNTNVPHYISANIANLGDSLLTNVSVTLNITGANTFTSTKTISSLNVASSALVNFAGFFPANLGIDTVTVSLSSDNNLMNNSRFVLQNVTKDTTAYSDGSKNWDNAWGWPVTGKGTFAAKYYFNGNVNLKGIRCFTYNGAGNTVRGIVYSKSGQVLAQSADYVLLAGDALNYINLNLTTPLAISNDSVYIGLFQTPSFNATAYYTVGTMAENPTRNGTFFEIDTLGNITDDGIYGIGKLMIEGVFESASGNELFVENFDFTGKLTDNGYTISSGGGTNPLTTGAAGLTFPGYPSTSGNALALTTSGEDDFKTFPADSVGSVYLSFLMNVSAAQATGDYFIALSPSWAQTNYYARIFAKATTGGFLMGIGKSNEGGKYGSTVFAFGTTYLVTAKYQFNNAPTVADTSNDAVSLYVFNGSIPAVEPSTGEVVNYVLNTKPDAGSFGAVTIRQGTASNTATLVIDGIRVGTTWFNSPLPVELNSFAAAVSGKSVNLTWKTASEINNKGFFIERKSGSGNWMSLGFIAGNGSSLSSKQYAFSDNNLAVGKYSYRLKQVDFDGSSSYSSVVNVDLTVPSEFALSQNYPNPFNPSTKIAYQLPVDSKVKVELYNITGQKVADLVNTDQSAGSYSIDVNANTMKNIASGVYIYRMTATGKVNGVTFVNSKKMMLMK